MRVVVAGSAGLIGTALIPLLRHAGHDVIRLVRRTPSAPDERGWDPPRGTVAPGALDGAGAVIDLCGVNVGGRRWTGEYKQAIRDSRIGPTEVLARAVAEQGIGVLVNASAIGYYGDTGDREIDEHAPAGTDFLATVCRDWEAASAPAERAGARVVALRSGLVLSRNGGLMGRLRPLFRFALGGRLGGGRQYWPWISLDDEVGAIAHLLGRDDVAGPVNMVGPQAVTNTEFTRTLAEAVGRPAPWVVPAPALRLVLGEFADAGVLAGQRAIPGVLRKTGYAFQHPTLADALAAAVDR
jgi:hypothetical protein